MMGTLVVKTLTKVIIEFPNSHLIIDHWHSHLYHIENSSSKIEIQLLYYFYGFFQDFLLGKKFLRHMTFRKFTDETWQRRKVCELIIMFLWWGKTNISIASIINILKEHYFPNLFLSLPKVPKCFSFDQVITEFPRILNSFVRNSVFKSSIFNCPSLSRVQPSRFQLFVYVHLIVLSQTFKMNVTLPTPCISKVVLK